MSQAGKLGTPSGGAKSHPEVRAAVRALCAEFPGAYWQELDHQRGYPEAFVQKLESGQ